MDAALAALDGAVRALVTAGPASAHTRAHPLCECAVMRAPAPAWRYLRRFPVLKRHLLAQWQEAMQRASTAKSSRKRAAEDQETQILDTLCMVLAQCGLLTLHEAELMRGVVTTPRRTALRRVILGSSLPLRLRLLLLGFALQEQDMTRMVREDRDWVADVAEKALEEVLEAVAQTARGSTGSGASNSRKRKRAAASKSRTAEIAEVQCAFCREGGHGGSLWSSNGGWDFLTACVQQNVHELEAAGEKPANNRALAVLLSFRNAVPSSETAATQQSSQTPRSSRRRSRTELSTFTFEVPNTGPTLSLNDYERLCQEATDAPPVLLPQKPSSGAGLHSKDLVAVRLLWESVWRRELGRFARTTKLSLTDVVSHCSKADAFALMATTSVSALVVDTHMRQLSGFRVVEKVVKYFAVDAASIITAFAQSWSRTDGDLGGTTALKGCNFGALASPSLQIIQRAYLRELLARRSSFQRATVQQRGSHLLNLLYSLFVVFLGSIPGDPELIVPSSFSEQWDALLIRQDEELPVTSSPQGGLTWCRALEECVKATQAEVISSYIIRSKEFTQAFRDYCLAIGYNILATGGETISSGGALQCHLIHSTDDRPVVRRVLTRMMTAFGDNWVCSLVTRLLRMESGLHRASGRVVNTLLFPALVSYMKAAVLGDRQRRGSGRQRFTSIVQAVNGTMKVSELTWLYLPLLVRLCEAWDAFHRTHTKDPLPREGQWGFRAMAELDMLPELLECYGRHDVLVQESSDTLAFTAELLQNALNCPPALESKVFEVVSRVKAAIDRPVGDNAHIRDQVDLVSHSDDVLKRLLRAVKFGDTLQTRRLMQEAKREISTFCGFKLQLERWVTTMEVQGTRVVGKESRVEMAMLCSRLILWFPDDFTNLRLLVNPLDSHLVYAFKSFVKDTKRSSGIVDRGALLVSSSSRKPSSNPSAVRLEMATRSYITASALPDLAGLTALLIKSLIKCRSPEAHDALVKIAQKNANILLSEVAVKTLSPHLQGVPFSTSVLTSFQGNEEGEMAKEEQFMARRKAGIHQRNALKVLEASSSIFEGGIPWSSALFGYESAETWLPHFFEFMLATDLSGDLDQASMLLESLVALVRTPKVAAVVLREGYWLEALLCTAYFAFTSQTAGAEPSKTQRRVRDLIKKIRCLVPLSQSERFLRSDQGYLASQHILGQERSPLLLHLSETKSSRVQIGECGLCSSSQRHNSKTASCAHLFVPFSCWLTGALVYSEAFVENPRDDMRTWERAFASYVTSLYLPFQFEGDVGKLLAAWVATWVCCNVSRAEEGQALLALLPFQVSLFRRLGSSSSSKRFVSIPLWELVFVGMDVAVQRPETLEDPTKLAQAVEVVVGSLATLELVDLSAAMDDGGVEDRSRLFDRVEGLLRHPQLQACGAGLLCYLLQFPLELLVSAYVCKIPADAESEATMFLQRVEGLVRDSFNVRSVGTTSVPGEVQDRKQGECLTDATAVKTEDADPGALYTSEKSSGDSSAAVESAEVAAFMLDWATQMQLKYEYLDGERCAEVLNTIRAAFSADTKS